MVEHLRLLAGAVAGRGIEVATAAEGEPAWTDGTTVYVEPAADWRSVAVQASLVAAGSLDPDVLRQVARRPALAARYLAVEGHRALAANEDALPPAVRRLVDHEVAARTASPAESLAVARATTYPLPALFGALQPRRAVAAAAAPEPARPPVELPDLPDEDDDERNLGDLLSSPVGGGGPLGKVLRRMLSPVRRRGEGGPPGADAPTHRTGRPSAGGGHAATSGPARIEEEVGAAPHRGATTYPEWDVHRRRYRPDWCTVVEGEPPHAAGDADLPAAPELRRALSRLGLGLEPCRRRRQGDEVDVDAAVEARLDALAGAPATDAVYVDRLRRRRDLSVLVLLDVSGSANEPGVAGRPVHEHQRAAAAGLVTALHELGDRVALHVFNSKGRGAVHVTPVKRFDDHLDGVTARRLHALEPGAYTRLGAAIRHGTALLEAKGGTPRRLLVVLSDGFAYDHGYEGAYGEADARRALLEARRRGVGCACLSVGAAAGAGADPEALRRVFGTAAHATVPLVDQLPGLVAPLFRTALATAEAQRRAFQRRKQ